MGMLFNQSVQIHIAAAKLFCISGLCRFSRGGEKLEVRTWVCCSIRVCKYIAAAKLFCISGLCRFSRGGEKLEVRTWFLNPYTDKKVHFVICPSHQVSYMYGGTCLYFVQWITP